VVTVGAGGGKGITIGVKTTRWEVAFYLLEKQFFLERGQAPILAF
jgi:hypothetical protein